MGKQIVLIVKIPLLRSFLASRSRRRLRQVLRGHRALQRAGRHPVIIELKEALTNAPFNPEATQASEWIFGAGWRDAEIIIRQYILIRVCGINLNCALLAAVGGGGAVVHPLPARWRQIVREHGFEVAEFRSAVWWHAYVAFLGTYGLWLFLRRILTGLRESTLPTFPAMSRYAYFDGLERSNLSQSGVDGRSYDILSWYLQWSERAPDVAVLAHSVRSVPSGTVEGVRVQPIDHPIPPLSRGGDILRFLVWGMIAGGRATVDFLRGRWWHAMLLSEAVKGAQIRLGDQARLACDYLFHNSRHIYRPLWTYEAAKRGARLILYFYSTNCEGFKRPFGYVIQANSWQLVNWPLYLVWDEGQADFVRRVAGADVTIRVVGPIWFHSSSTELPALPPRTIAVFDVQPVRSSFYSQLGIAFDYYTVETATRFLGDIHDCARKCGAKFALKRKRKIGRLVHPAYRKFVERLDASERLAASPSMLVINPDISATRLIEKSALVLSMPFTSTALVARNLGKPSYYYDPSGIIQKDDRAAHGIPVISGVDELQEILAMESAKCNTVPQGSCVATMDAACGNC
jgi:polysaccharide biosynthesis PFTS motif protein